MSSIFDYAKYVDNHAKNERKLYNALAVLMKRGEKKYKKTKWREREIEYHPDYNII